MLQSVEVNGNIVETKNGLQSASFNVNLESGYKACIEIVGHPTGNCQMFSIGYFNNLLGLTKDRKEVEEAIINCIAKLNNCSGKRLMMFDVKNTLSDRIHSEHEVIFSNEYVSTNGSNMVCGMIKLKN